MSDSRIGAGIDAGWRTHRLSPIGYSPLDDRSGFKITGSNGTHRNAYAGGRYVHLAANMAGYSGNIYVILDITDPPRPVEVGRWWVPGQHVAAGEHPSGPGILPHGPAVRAGDLVRSAGLGPALQSLPTSDLVVQSEDVLVDRRGKTTRTRD